MKTDTDSTAVTSGFIQMSLTKLRAIHQSDAGYNELAAYIVLCSGVNGRQPDRLCTHGAKSVSHRSGMSYRSAEKAIEWLKDNGVIRLPSENEPRFLGKRETRSTMVRYVINDDDCLDVAVSQIFVEGVKGSSKDAPLKRILFEVDGDDEIPRAQAVMDAIVLFAALMKEQDFGACAGVDPDAWHHAFEPIDDDEDGDGSSHVQRLPNSKNVMVTVKESSQNYAIMKFVDSVFGAAVETEKREILSARFWHAMHQLRQLGLIYQVHVLWDGNPLDRKQRRQAEPWATQYIKDAWARQVDPYLQHIVNNAAWRTGARDANIDFSDGQPSFVGSGRYRYIIRAVAQKRAFLVGQLRVRYWAANESTVRGREQEKQRTNALAAVISELARA